MKKRRDRRARASTPAAEPDAPTVTPPAAQEAAAATSPAGRDSRPAIRAVFVAFVLFQLVVPLSYYARDDRYDERFAWRMFSAIRMGTCEPTASETRHRVETPLVLSDEIHYAWIEHLARNRRPVIERFLASRCDHEGVSRATLVNVCRDTEGERTRDFRYERRCDSAALKTSTADADSGGAR